MKLRPSALAFVSVLLAACSVGDLPAGSSSRPSLPLLPTSPTNTAAQVIPSSDPYAGLPSNPCGGFHLKLINELSESVRLTIGTDWVDIVAAGDTETVTQSLTQPMPPPLPWLVEVYDATGRITLFRQTMTGPVDQKVSLREGSAVATAYSLQDEGC